jgi:hypothetical protein
MKRSRKIIISALTALVAIIMLILFAPVINVNVIFDRCLNENEIATVFQGTSFRSYQYSFVQSDGSGGGETSNAHLFGTPLEGADLEAALTSEPEGDGVAVVDGRVSLLDVFRIEKRPFVYHVAIYSPLFDGFDGYDREILPESTSLFYENSPEARYWE